MRVLSPIWTLWSSTLLPSPTAALQRPLRTRQLDAAFDWTAIVPTPDLQYHPCYDTFQCARLQVPLDWTKHSNTTTNNNNAHAAIAIVTLPATVPPTDPAYAGPILINPGGPGGSGTEMALGIAAIIQSLVDIPGVRHYDILGFDPRGVALTTPSASCYASQFDRAADGMRADGMPSVLEGLGLKMKFEMARGVAGLCAQATAAAGAAGEASVFRYMSTASVARDMLEIVERVHALHKGNGTVAGKACGGGKPKLQYLGFSYGSLLGNTFASMFPDRIGRIVVDGIVDGADYVAGTWQKNIDDGEAAIDIFYRTCFDAGSACVLRQSTDTSFSDIRARVDALLRSLRGSPVSAIYNNRVHMITSYLVSETIRTALYTPIATYESLSRKLAGALAGNFTLILSDDTVVRFSHPTDVCTEEKPNTSPPKSYNFADEASTGIICSDSQASAGTRDLAWAASTVGRVTNQSSTIGEAWSKVPLACAEWPFAPPYAFKGPFGSPAPKNGSDAAPLLILSTRTDHATPLANAFALSRLHGGSAVVVQESVGHCALMASVSLCTYGIVREYFHTGKVPANGTVCEAECAPAIPYKACPGLPA